MGAGSRSHFRQCEGRSVLSLEQAESQSKKSDGEGGIYLCA